MLSLAGMNGLGQTSYGRFKCNSTICYGTDGGATHALFKETQYQMNRAGAAIFGSSWTPIKVDGFIGSGTVSAARKLFPKIPEIVERGFQSPKSYVELAQVVDGAKNARGEPLISTALRAAADRATGRAEPPQQVMTRTESYSQEGPAKVSSTGQPVVTKTSPDVAVSPTSQIPADATGYESGGTSKAGKRFALVVAGLAAVGLVGAAVYAQRRRRRRA